MSFLKISSRKEPRISKEDFEVLQIMNSLKKELEYVHQSLDYVTNPVLIDSYIYEIKALHMKYEYYLNICKEKGIMGNLQIN